MRGTLNSEASKCLLPFVVVVVAYNAIVVVVGWGRGRGVVAILD